ncbi:hypothetical protein ANANG_G00073610, partial [Anguilla anguilla]
GGHGVDAARRPADQRADPGPRQGAGGPDPPKPHPRRARTRWAPPSRRRAWRAAPRPWRPWRRPPACPSSLRPRPPPPPRREAGEGAAVGGAAGLPGVPPPGVRPPQLALLAAQTMHQIRHPRLPMAQFGAPSPRRPAPGGPSPCAPSARAAPTAPRNTTALGARPGPSHAEYAAAASSTGANPASAATATPPSVSASARPAPQRPHPLVRQEAAVRARAQGRRGDHHGQQRLRHAAGGFPRPPARLRPPARHALHPLPLPSPAHPTAARPQTGAQRGPTPGKEKPSLEATPTPVTAAGFLTPSAPPGPSPSRPRPRPCPPQPPVPFSSGAEPATPALVPPTSANLAPSCSVAHTSNAPAPRMSHRMQPPGPFYPLPEQQSVFVPLNVAPEPLKQQQQHPGHAPPPPGPPA